MRTSGFRNKRAQRMLAGKRPAKKFRGQSNQGAEVIYNRLDRPYHNLPPAVVTKLSFAYIGDILRGLCGSETA